MVNAGEAKPGQTILIQGTGGVSVFALQFGKALGTNVIGISSSDDKLARAAGLGLDAGTNYRKQPEWEKWVMEQTGAGADVIVEVGGSGTFVKSLQAIKTGGVVAQIGVLSSSDQPLNIGPILHKQVNIKGIYVGSRSHFLEMNRAISQTGLKPVIDAVHSFGDAPKAFQAMETAAHFGKIVVKVGGDR